MVVRALAGVIALGPALGACQAQPASEARAPALGLSRVSAPEGAAGAGDVAGVGMEVVVERFAADARDVERFYDAPWSEARWGRLEGLHARWDGLLDDAAFEGRDQEGRIDWLLLDAHIRARGDDLTLDRGRLAEIDALLPFREAIVGLEVARWQIAPADPRAMAEAVAEIAEQAEAVAKRVKRAQEGDGAEEAGEEEREGDQPSEGGSRQAASLPHPSTASVSHSSDPGGPLRVRPAVALRAAGAVGALRRTLETTTTHYMGYKPEFDWWVSQPREEAVKALREYEERLRKEIAGIKGEDDDPLVGDPIGRAALLADLRAEMIAYTPEELIAIAERELAWRREAMVEAAREMGFGDDWRAALEAVKDGAVDPGAQDLYVAEVAREAIAFLKERDMVTIPPLCEELWRTEMIPARRQELFPFAYYGGLHVGIAYPTDEMSHEDKLASMRGNNRHFTRSVVPHELIPGHHLQGFMARRHNPHRRLFSTPFLVEGWALYWEMTLWDAGWPQTPEDRIGLLFWGMHRCARIIVSLRYHLGEMTPEEMIDFLVEEIGHERFGATSEVRRYIGDDYSPLYQVAYMIGGLQLRALRAEAVDSGLMTEREFHDAVLTYGPIPIELIRAGVLELPLTTDWEAEWRFAGDPPPTPTNAPTSSTNTPTPANGAPTAVKGEQVEGAGAAGPGGGR